MSVKILVGDVRKMLATIEADSVDCVVTSPPYWGLRSYLAADHPDKHLEMGSERTLSEHITTMVEVFREVRRVMKPTAPFWLNYGDCYATAPNGRSAAATKAAGNDDRTFRDKPFSTVGPIYPPDPGNPFPNVKRRGGGNNSDPTLKPKDLCLIPFRLVIALQEDGWWVRSRCMWGKPNGMPDSSGKYRPSVAHEEVFMLGKTDSPFYDHEAVCGPVTGSTHARVSQEVLDTRYLRSYEPIVWHIPTAAYGEAHYATFPPALVERCLLAGLRKDGARYTVLDPFGGAGTTAMVADRMGHDAILIELNEVSTELARARIKADAGMFSDVT